MKQHLERRIETLERARAPVIVLCADYFAKLTFTPAEIAQADSELAQWEAQRVMREHEIKTTS